MAIYNNVNGSIFETNHKYENVNGSIFEVNAKYQNVNGTIYQTYKGGVYLIKNGILQVDPVTTSGGWSTFFDYIYCSEPTFRFVRQFSGYTEIWGGTSWHNYDVIWYAGKKVIISGDIKYYGYINSTNNYDLTLTSILGTTTTVSTDKNNKTFIYEEHVHNKICDIGVLCKTHFNNLTSYNTNFYVQFYGDVYSFE